MSQRSSVLSDNFSQQEGSCFRSGLSGTSRQANIIQSSVCLPHFISAAAAHSSISLASLPLDIQSGSCVVVLRVIRQPMRTQHQALSSCSFLQVALALALALTLLSSVAATAQCGVGKYARVNLTAPRSVALILVAQHFVSFVVIDFTHVTRHSTPLSQREVLGRLIACDLRQARVWKRDAQVGGLFRRRRMGESNQIKSS